MHFIAKYTFANFLQEQASLNRVPLNEPFGMDLDQIIEDCEKILAELKTAATQKATVFILIQKIRETIEEIKKIEKMKEIQKTKKMREMKRLDEFIEDLIGYELINISLDILLKFTE